MKISKILFIYCLLFFSGGSYSYAQDRNDLTYFLKQAESNSPLLNDYNNQILLNRIDSLKLRANYGFIVSGELNSSYSPVIKGWGYDNALSNGQSVFAGIRLTKEFISAANKNTRLAAFNANIAQVLAQKNLSLQSLRKQISDQYITTYSSQLQYQLSKEIIDLLHQEDVVLKKLTQSSAFKQTDYLNFKVNLQQNELSMQQHLADWQNNYGLLKYISGIANDVFLQLTVPQFEGAVVGQKFDESLYAKAFVADSLKIVNDAKIIAYDYKMKVTAFSDGGYQSTFVQAPYKNVGLSVGLGLSLPIYDGHRKKMLLQQNDLAMETRMKYLKQIKNQYSQQLFQISNQLDQYQKLIQTANQQMVYAQTLVVANVKQLPTGDVKMVDYILSINNLLNLKVNLIQYQANVWSLQNQLQYLILPQL